MQMFSLRHPDIGKSSNSVNVDACANTLQHFWMLFLNISQSANIPFKNFCCVLESLLNYWTKMKMPRLLSSNTLEHFLPLITGYLTVGIATLFPRGCLYLGLGDSGYPLHLLALLFYRTRAPFSNVPSCDTPSPHSFAIILWPWGL